uniref:PHD-type domain-containing protein n=1 Tax=Oryza punctata TaxID=4537 RepID=A0A0E0JRV6_ORYPU
MAEDRIIQPVVINSEIVRDKASIEDEAMYNGARALIELSQGTPGGFCKVCNEVEKPDKRFLICGHSLCPYTFYHNRCLKPEQIASSQQQGNEYWYCPSCLCRVCKLDRDDEHIILCDGCDEGYHLYCLIPPLTSVPEGQWRCSSCIVQEEKEAKRRFYEQKILRLHRKDIATNVSMFETDDLAQLEAANVLMLLKNSSTNGEIVVSHVCRQ